MEGTTRRRGVSLRDQAAEYWFARRGYTIEYSTPLILFADSLDFTDFSVARLWHSPSTLRRQKVERATSPTLFTFVVEGEIAFAHPSVGRPLGPGSVGTFPGGSGEAILSTTEGTARYEIEVETGLLELYGINIDYGIHEVQSAGGYIYLLISFANALLESKLKPDPSGVAQLRSTILNLLSAVVRGDLLIDSGSCSTTEATLLLNARRVIAMNASEPGFSVHSLADSVGTSERYLQRIFAAAGTSPSAAIRAERVRVARTFQPDLVNASPDDLTRIARLAGFANVRRLRDALSRTDTTSRAEGNTAPPREQTSRPPAAST
ncbi:AraC family transcriptional regulator [Microbacteriaceae bacterium VKM Ac-2855]|nr:AraC family transcriptional regulator [Microbacteriaceae bacterium VKM Ac-2855]